MSGVSLARILSVHERILPCSKPVRSRGRRLIERAYAASSVLPNTFDHDHATHTALHLAEAGMSAKSISLGLLHHLPLEQVETTRAGSSAYIRSGLDSLAMLRQPEMSTSMASLGGVYEYGNAKVAEVLEGNPSLIPIILASALDTLIGMQHNQRRPVFELRLSEPTSDFAEDVLDYLAPFCHFYHLVGLTWKIEDAVLAVRDPDLFQKLRRTLPSQSTARRRIVDVLQSRLRECLKSEFSASRSGFRIQGRPKGVFSIAEKLGDSLNVERELWNIGDLVAMRVVIEDFEGLFGKGASETLAESGLSEDEQIYRASMQVTEAIAGKFTLRVGKLDDYLHYPRPTGYRALHIGIALPADLRRKARLSSRFKDVEVQIRTRELHEHAEFGEWSHVRYKLQPRLGRGPRQVSRRDAKREWGQNWAEFFSSRVLFRAPDGNLMETVRGATYADAAYRLMNTDEHPLRVKIENSDFSATREYEDLFEPLVPLSRLTVVRSGIPDSAPSPGDLSKLRTQVARRKVAALFESFAPSESAHEWRESLIEQGEQILKHEQELTRRWSYGLGRTSATTSDALKVAGTKRGTRYATRDELLLAVARGTIDSDALLRRWREEFDKAAEIRYKADLRQRELHWKSAPIDETVHSLGRLRAISYNQLGIKCALKQTIVLATCCGPVPGDHLVGWNFRVPAPIQQFATQT